MAGLGSSDDRDGKDDECVYGVSTHVGKSQGTQLLGRLIAHSNSSRFCSCVATKIMSSKPGCFVNQESWSTVY